MNVLGLLAASALGLSALGCATTGTDPGSGASRAVPENIVAVSGARFIPVGSSPVTILDFHKDGEGYSGGLMMTAQRTRDTLKVTTVQTGGKGDSKGPTTDVQEFKLAGFRRATVATSVADVEFRAEP